MRVLLDTNILISFLLSDSGPDSPMGKIIASAANGTYSLIVAEEVIAETRETVEKKQYLRRQIDQSIMNEFVVWLKNVGEVLPPLTGTAPSVTRDGKDDFLLAAAAIGDVDFLVSGDHDLHAIKMHVSRPTIVTPSEFAVMLDAIERR